MEESKKVDLDFSNNLNYALSNLKQAIEKANVLKDKTYLELSKQQIIDYLNYVYVNIKKWKNDYEAKNTKQLQINIKK